MISVHRTSIRLTDGEREFSRSLDSLSYDGSRLGLPTVGDWLTLSVDQSKIMSRLERKSVFKRPQTLGRSQFQTIAANVDHIFVVTSCNSEFNESRLDRYLVATAECGLPTVVVLTKRDTCDDVDSFVKRARSLRPDQAVVAINAHESSTFEPLRSHFDNHRTVVLVGSSGVGKSTLVNSLATSPIQATRSIRSADDRGRHTTSARTLVRLDGGGMVIDVPGMREFGLMDVRAAIDQHFADVVALAGKCRFKNCQHDTEPNCAIKEALNSGTLDQRRFANFQKLVQEDAIRTRDRSERVHDSPKGRFDP